MTHEWETHLWTSFDHGQIVALQVFMQADMETEWRVVLYHSRGMTTLHPAEGQSVMDLYMSLA